MIVSLQYPNLGSLKEERIVGYNDAALQISRIVVLNGGGGGGVIVFLVGSDGKYEPNSLAV